MYNITICIPTYKRPLMLEKLILSITGCHFNNSLIKDIHIIIADNDIQKTAELMANDLSATIPQPFQLRYINYPIKGLANVRNELLRRAFELDTDFITFIDDDEYVTSNWLYELITTIVKNDGDMAMGPVIPVFESNIPAHISNWFIRRSHPNNGQLFYIRSGNLIISTKSLLKYNVWFDERFNKTGSEDSYFGRQMIKKGAVIYWAANAIAYETTPDTRANIAWLLKRRYRTAYTFTYMLKLEKSYFRIIKKIASSLTYVLSGICMCVIIPFPITKRYWGLLKLSEGIGGLAGLANFSYNEYK